MTLSAQAAHQTPSGKSPQSIPHDGLERMSFSFTRFKDKISGAVHVSSRWLANSPKPVQKIGYGLFKGLFWIVYFWPKSHMRLTAIALSAAVQKGPPRDLYRGFVNGVVLFAQRMERMSAGHTEEIDRLFQMPEKERFDSLLDEHGGAILALPHSHGALLMVRGLAARYPVLMLIREPKNDSRAASQRRYFANLGCEVLDVRRNNEAVVARTVLKALRGGKIVIGTVDRIKGAPPAEEPVSKTDDNVRATAFGQPVGVAGWPARFAAKCKVPILPVMVEQSKSAIVLHIGKPIAASELVETTQAWVSALEQFFRKFPTQWIFVYDKHWSRLLRKRA